MAGSLKVSKFLSYFTRSLVHFQSLFLIGFPAFLKVRMYKVKLRTYIYGDRLQNMGAASVRIFSQEIWVDLFYVNLVP